MLATAKAIDDGMWIDRLRRRRRRRRPPLCIGTTFHITPLNALKVDRADRVDARSYQHDGFVSMIESFNVTKEIHFRQLSRKLSIFGDRHREAIIILPFPIRYRH